MGSAATAARSAAAGPARAGAVEAARGAAGAQAERGPVAVVAREAGAQAGRAQAGPTVIVAALPAELVGVLAAVETARPVRPSAGGGRHARRWRRATLAGEEVVVAATGDGPAAAAAGAEALCAALAPRRLLVLGVAGGLTPGLAAGSLVAARQVMGEDGAGAPAAPDAAWLARAVAAGAAPGVAVTAEAIAIDPAAKRRLLRGVVAAGGGAAGLAGAPAEAAETCGWPPATVDIESLAYARCAAAHGVPYLVVRAVLDDVEETLPLDFEACRTGGGGVSSVRVVLRAMARPACWGALWRLRGRVAAAAARLAEMAEVLVPPAETATTRGIASR